MPKMSQPPSVKGLPTCLLALLLGATAVQASAEPTSAISPTKVEYKSSLETYQAYTDQSVQSWRDANDQVGSIGGWRTYAKEMRASEPAKDPSNLPDPHAGHHGEGKK